jgi:hypothetical protein
MKKLTDRELDDLFKSAAEGYQPSFDSADWEAMNHKLNEKPASTWKKWTPFMALSLAVFFTGVWVGTRLMDSHQPVLPKEKPDSGKAVTGLANQEEANAIANNKATAQEVPLRQLDGMRNQNKQLTKKEKDSDLLSVRMAEDMALIKENRVDESIVYPGEVPFWGLVNGQEKNVPDSVSGFERADVTPDTAVIRDEREEVVKRTDRVHSLSVRLLAAPDFSSINFYPTKEMGSNYSIQLEYQLHPRLSVSTGAILSSKKYSSDKEVIYSGYRANDLIGSCRVMDVPVQLYYYLQPDKKTNFFAGLGASSYPDAQRGVHLFDSAGLWQQAIHPAGGT